jgi:hypothetical protein
MMGLLTSCSVGDQLTIRINATVSHARLHRAVDRSACGYVVVAHDEDVKITVIVTARAANRRKFKFKHLTIEPYIIYGTKIDFHRETIRNARAA